MFDYIYTYDEIKDSIEHYEEKPEKLENKLPIESSKTFIYTSGAGGWATNLCVDPDGSFTGHYLDSDIGDTGVDYPNGTCYLNDFSGSFGEVTKLDDNTYRMKLGIYDSQNYYDTEEIRDGTLYKYVKPYGLTGGVTFYLYMPSKPCNELPEDFLKWVNVGNDKTLGKYGLYNPDMGWAYYEFEE